MIEKITSLDDERLDVYARLTEVQLRNKLEPEKGIFIAESDKVIDRAFDAGYEPLSLLIPDHKLNAMRGLIDRAQAAWWRFHSESNNTSSDVEVAPSSNNGEISSNCLKESSGSFAAELKNNKSLPVFVAPAEEIEKLAGYELTRGVLCAMRRKLLPSVRDLLESTKARRIAILEDITNHTNVGAAFRSAAALGVDAILVTPACCDPLYRRAVRVSMGTVFQVPWTRIGMDIGLGSDVYSRVDNKRSGDKRSAALSFDRIDGGDTKAIQSDAWPIQGLQMLRNLGFTSAALALSDNSVSLDDPCLKQCEKLALVLGTEGDGLSDHTIAACDYTVKIPMAHGVDSLNVAAASAVAFWELRAR